MAHPLGKITGAAAIAAGLLVGLEGYEAKPYLDSAGVLTDCYGNTKNVSRQIIRTKAECQELLQGEAGRIATFIARDDQAHSQRISMNALAAMISWTYNVGDGAYRQSTARKYMLAGNYEAMCREMYRWNKITVAGVKITLPGLNNRRAVEVALCLKPDGTP